MENKSMPGFGYTKPGFICRFIQVFNDRRNGKRIDMRKQSLFISIIISIIALCGQVFGDDPITIISTGYVGINKDTPQYQLDIDGSVNITGSLNANGSLFARGGINFTGTSGTYQGIFKDDALTLALGGTADTASRIYLFGENFPEADKAGEIWLQTSGGIKTIYMNGKVGIGTSDPETELHVKGRLFLENSDIPTIYGGTGSTDRYLCLLTIPALNTAMGLKSGGLLVADTYTYANPGKNDLIVKGRVGINTSAPVDYAKVTIGCVDSTEILFTGAAHANINSTQGAICIKAGSGFGVFLGSNNVDGHVALVNGNLGIGVTPSSTYKLDVAGTVRATGSFTTSDRRLKKDIRPLEKSLANVLRLQGVSYNWKQEEYSKRNFTAARQIGFIAQEVEPVLPEVVETDAEGYKSVDYSKLTALLVEAVKELKAEKDKEIDLLQQEIEVLKAELALVKSGK